MPIRESKYIWFNGEMVPWEKATVHVMTHALHYGSSVFEGIRAYETPQGAAIFRLREHIRRLFDSCRIYRMDPPFTPDQVFEACRAVVRENGLQNAYIRPLVWRGYGEMGLNPLRSPVEVMVAAMEWGAYLGAEGLEHGVDVHVSSWQRVAPNTLPAMAKAGGNYLSSQLIVMEAARNGYAEGIALDVHGWLSEGSGENLFLIRDGVIYTPPVTAALLPGITRDAVITLAQQLGYQVREQNLPREMLYLADELFFTGTAAEVTPIRSVDKLPVGSGKRGPITTAIQKAFFGLFSGETEDRWGWLTPAAE
ncbi:branched-chain amino acid transaminase [Roseiflexus sp. RS-1]|jgi:branched-chain amino acid aminotransferase|uniref:branched-chain amino acid transaminase n=1 Tax=Roseiflexus sp. (strain RS-1) TaxID=357808 RepID=UPI0000D7F3E7|nr:branched-chain amino acid transaminase [Roseiflexus sp. RS-1]ABQ90349.1 branched-chain amino acid aminotransferase [Roseiflexus sp. RS-1]MBO9323049.1 branched-chain amino acid transaminase [Roseiflexus sp.]